MVNKRFWSIGVLALALALVALGFLATSAQAAEPKGQDGQVSVGQADQPPDPEWEMERDRALAHLAKLHAKLDAALAERGAINEKQLDIFLFEFFRGSGIHMRNRDRLFDARERRRQNCFEQGGSSGIAAWCAQYGLGTGTAGQGQGTQQGTTTGQTTQQGTTTGQGTQQGTGQGTQQGGDQGTQQGGIGFSLVGAGNRSRTPLRMGSRCTEVLAGGNTYLDRFAMDNGAAYADVVGRLCSGTQLGDIRLGYWISRRTGVAADVVFGQRTGGMSWQEIVDAYDLRFDVREFDRR